MGKHLFYFFADNNCRLFYKSPIIEKYSYRCALSIFDLFVDNSVAMQHDSIPITREMYRGIIVMVPIRWIGIKCALQSQRQLIRFPLLFLLLTLGFLTLYFFNVFVQQLKHHHC